jgi:ferric-dicitrate binding protein FerR (iron transport regulator)
VATRLLDVEPDVRITSTQLVQGELLFEWSPDPAATFVVEQTTNLITWTQVADVAGDVAQWQTPLNAERAFFRVIKQ